MNINDIDDLYEEWVDQINSNPLTTSRLSEFIEVININQNIVNNIYNIRRFLEINDTVDDMVDDIDDIPIYNHNVNPVGFNLLHSNMINTIFGLFLEGTINEVYNNETYEDVKVTLTEDQFKKFCKINMSNENVDKFTGKDCNICMEEYKLEDSIVELSCKHLYHESCIKNWLCNEKISCPVCRKDMRESI